MIFVFLLFHLEMYMSITIRFFNLFEGIYFRYKRQVIIMECLNRA